MVYTLLLYSLDPYWQTEWRTEKQNTFFAWAGGTFFPVVLLCQFLVLAGNRFWYFILLCTLSIIQLWCCVSFFGSGGKKFLVLRTYLEYNTVVRLCNFFCCGGKVNFVRIFLFNPNFLLFLILVGNSFWCYVRT